MNVNRRALGLTLGGAVLLFGLYALAGFLLVPYLVERQVPDAVREQLIRADVDVDLTFGRASFNPFLLRLQLRDTRLSRPAQDEPLLALDRLVVDLAWASLWHRGWIVSELDLTGAQVRATIDRKGRLDWASLLQRDSGAEEASPLELLLTQIAVHSGRFTLSDLRGDGAASATLAAIEFSASDIATYSRESADAVKGAGAVEGAGAGQYRLSAAFEAGGTVQAEGTLTLAPLLRSRGKIALADLELPGIWPLVRRLAGFDLAPVGESLSAGSRYAYAAVADSPTVQLDAAQLRLDNPVLRVNQDETPLLRLRTLAVNGGHVDFAKRESSFDSIELGDGAIRAMIDAKGRIDWRALGESSRATATDSHGWRVRVGALSLEDVGVHGVDRSRSQPLVLDVASLDAKTTLSLETGTGSTSVRLDSLNAEFHKLSLTLAGDAGATESAESAGSAKTAKAAAALLGLDVLTVTGAMIDSGERRLAVEQISAKGGRAELQLDDAGPPGILQALRSAAAPAGEGKPDAGAAPSSPATTGSDGATEAWRYAIGTIEVNGQTLVVRHSGFEPAVAYRAEVSNASIEHVDSSAETPIDFDVRLSIIDGGLVQASGSVGQNGADASIDLQIEQLPLVPLQPLLAKWARLEMQSGTLSSVASLKFSRDNGRSEGAGPGVRATGSAELRSVRIEEAASGDRFLSWQRLEAERFVLDTTARGLSIAEIRIQEPGAKLLIAKDRSVNLTQVLLEKDSPPENGFEVTVDRVVLERGVLDYADLSLVLPFSTQVTSLQGSVVDISSRRDERARIDASGEIGEFGSARVEGSLLPFAPKQFLNLVVVMENVAMPALSPYTATFAGRKVAEGKLWLDLEYRIENSELLGKNDIRLADFRLGEQVEAADAPNLPLDLAVALLTDDQGNIELSVPVRGDLGKPTFDFGVVLREAFGGLLERIVSAPFRAIGRLFDGNGEAQQDLARIEFAAGSATLAPPQREKLERVAQALGKRPMLQLTINATYAPERDARALRERAARRELAGLLNEETRAGAAPGLIAYDSERTQRALEGMLAQYAGDQALADLRATQSGQEADGLYRRAFARVVDQMPLPVNATTRLAVQRADAIRQYLVEKSGVSAPRVRSGSINRIGGTGGQRGGENDGGGAVASTLEILAAESRR